MQSRPLSQRCLPVLEAAVLWSLQMSLHTYSFSPTPCKLPEEPAHTQTSLDVMHTRQVPNSCLLATGWVPERRGGGGKPHQKQEPILQFSTPSAAQLPGYCPRPGRHLLWVISICMAIITAFGKKIPLSESPAELLMPAQNWRRQLRQTPARLLPITRGPPVPTAPYRPRESVDASASRPPAARASSWHTEKWY